MMKSYHKKTLQWLKVFLRWGLLFSVIIAGIIYMIKTPGKSYQGPIKKLSYEEMEIRDHLKRHVRELSQVIGERNLHTYDQLKLTAQYISMEFEKMGYEVSKQKYHVNQLEVENLEAELKKETKSDEIIIMGAHYDTVPMSPGANDNASGVAALLEISRLISKGKIEKAMRFVAFVNEEPPYFKTSSMGSYVYAERSYRRKEKIKAMFSLETIGYYSDEKGSQHYPFPFSFFYPDTGNFIGFVSNIGSRKLLFNVMEKFRKYEEIPSEGVAAPGWITGIDWSDQWAFWKRGYSAIMITDTALFRYPYYHTPQDTWEKLDYGRMAKIVNCLAKVIIEL